MVPGSDGLQDAAKRVFWAMNQCVLMSYAGATMSSSNLLCEAIHGSCTSTAGRPWLVSTARFERIQLPSVAGDLGEVVRPRR